MNQLLIDEPHVNIGDTPLDRLIGFITTFNIRRIDEELDNEIFILMKWANFSYRDALELTPDQRKRYIGFVREMLEQQKSHSSNTVALDENINTSMWSNGNY